MFVPRTTAFFGAMAAVIAVATAVFQAPATSATPGTAATRGFLPAAAPRRSPLVIISPPAKTSDLPLPDLPPGKSFVVLDARTGADLASSAPDEHLPIASLTKLAAALVVVGTQPDWQRRVTVQSDDLREGSEPILIPGESVTIEELFAASLIGSSNVATAALARSTGLTIEQFVARMNRVADTLGLHQTSFVEPTGLDPKNVSTAREIGLLARAAFGDLRIRRHLLAPSVILHPEPSKSLKSRIVKSTDALLSSDLVAPPFAFHGGKTGSLGAETGYHFAMMVGNGQRRDIIVAVLGSETAYTRFDAARSLAQWTFKTHRWNE